MDDRLSAVILPQSVDFRLKSHSERLNHKSDAIKKITLFDQPSFGGKVKPRHCCPLKGALDIMLKKSRSVIPNVFQPICVAQSTLNKQVVMSFHIAICGNL